MLSVPTETSTMLGLAGLLMTCLLAIYVYLSKKTCFQSASRCWCCQKSSHTSKRKISKELVNAFSYDEEVSSECDEDVMRHLQQRPQCKYDSKFSNYLCEGGNGCKPFDKQLIDYDKQDVFNGGVDPPLLSANGTDRGIRTGRSIQRQQSVCTDEGEPSASFEHYKHRSKNILKQQAIYASLALKNNSKTLESLLANKEAKNGSKDLISLAEKGRIGKQTSTEDSVSSDAASAEGSIILEKKNILRRLKTASSETETKETTEGHKYQMLSNYLDTYESDTQSSNLPDFSPNTTLSEPNMSAPVKCGRLEASFAYDAPSKRLCVSVIQANEIPYKEQRTGVNQIYVQVILLPHKKQKYKTKSKPIFCSTFNESFTFNRINPEEIMNLGLRFRVYSIGFARKTHLIGESRLLFACMKPQQQETKLWFSLEPIKRNPSDIRSDVSSLARTDSTSSQSLHNSMPELLLGLSYNGTTGRLSVTIIKGSQFRSISTRAPDTYVKMSLISSSSQEIARSKTSVCRGQPNPHFKETFIFQVALFQLPDVTLMLFAYNKRSIKRKELMGWISLGYNSSGEEELSHWNDMRDSKGEQVCRWHVLLESIELSV